jgi:signal transduction histidine kinase
MNRSQIWGEPFEYRFTIVPPFWQRWWFYTVCGILILSSVVLVMKRRTRNILKNQKERSDSERRIAEIESKSQQAILNERLRISSELHDEVGATLSGIAMYSHLTKEQMKSGEMSEIEKSLNVMQESSAQMVDKLNDIVWLINPEQDSLEKLMNVWKNMQPIWRLPGTCRSKLHCLKNLLIFICL